MVDKDCDPKCAADFCVDALYFSSSSLMEINCSKLKYDHDTMDKLMKMPVWPCSLHYEKSLKKNQMHLFESSFVLLPRLFACGFSTFDFIF